MKEFLLSVPSKTFLLGEYAALHGEAAMVLTTAPRFKLKIVQQSKAALSIKGIHFASPAGKLLQRDEHFFEHYGLDFVDAHRGLGGFGASSAQFVMTAVFKEFIRTQRKRLNEDELLLDYNNLAWDGEGIAPSGVDLIAQMHGGICFFAKEKNQLKNFSWPFPDLGYGLIHTGNKLATHVHLKKFNHFDTSELEKIVYEGLISLEKKDSESFIKAIKNYATLLQKKQLVANYTELLLKKISSCSDILAAKGCGALGSDVILIIFNINKREVITSWLKKNQLNLVVDGNEVANGLSLQVNER